MSFLSDYRIYSSGNESPPTYHLFSSLVALASVISRRVWIDMGYFVIYPNLYVILVGPPGNKKSTAIGLARGLLHRLKTVPFSGECTSKEKLVLDMVAGERLLENNPPFADTQRVYSPLTIMVSELSEFLQISTDNMIGFITDVFDINFPYEHKTKNKGSVVINGPYLCILAGTTPSWMTTYLRSDIITGGFTRRCIFIYEQDRPKRIAFPKDNISQEHINAWQRVFLASERISKLKGEFQWTPEAREFYRHWYENLKVPSDANTVGYYETKHIQLLKLAMLYAISETEALTIRIDDLRAGLDFLSLVEANLARVFEGMGSNQLNAASARLLDTLRSTPVAEFTLNGKTLKAHIYPRKKLEVVMYSLVNADDFNKILEHLIRTDRVKSLVCKLDNVDREIIVLVDGLLQKG